jgi:beta-lactamase regulating signal transducer with metallopeptidase domain
MRTLVEYGLANAAAATLLALAALLVGLVIRRPAVRNALWVLVLVRLVLPPVWTVTFTVPAPEPTPAAPAAGSTSDPAPAPDLVVVNDGPADVGGEVAATPAAAVPALPAAVDDAALPERTALVSAFTIAAIVWAAGTLFVFVRSGGRIVRFRRAVRDARPAPAKIQRQADELARAMGLRRCPDVRLVPGRVSPALWMPGLCTGRATLILPAGLVPLLDDRQRAAVIAHELAHLRRGDPWVRWLELVVSGLYWWHPLLGWFRRELRAAEEECCDLRVVAAVGGRRDYATALVETAAFLGGSGPMPALASGAGPVRHLQRRVTMIMRATWPAGLTRFGLAAVLGLGGLGLAFGPAVAQDRDRDEKRDTERKERDRVEPRKEPPADELPRERVRDRDEGPPRDRADREAIEKAREAVERARRVAREAAEQLRTAEEALARAEGRPGPRREARDPGDRRPEYPQPPAGVPGMRPVPPVPPTPLGRRPDGGGEFRDLQTQIEELRRSLEQMRQELRRERGGKEPEPRRERPKDEPKRPVREAERM